MSEIVLIVKKVTLWTNYSQVDVKTFNQSTKISGPRRFTFKTICSL